MGGEREREEQAGRSEEVEVGRSEQSREEGGKGKPWRKNKLESGSLGCG